MTTTSPKIAVRAFRADPATTAPTTTASATPTRAGFTAPDSWARRSQLRVCRRREDPEGVERPVAQPGTADDLRHRHGPEGPRVLRILAMVAREAHVARRDDPRVLVPLHGGRVRWRAVWLGVEVGLLDLGSVD